jgi:hypothetical protein
MRRKWPVGMSKVDIQRERRRANPEKDRIARKRYRDAHKDNPDWHAMRRNTKNKWLESRPGYAVNARREWANNNPDKVKAQRESAKINYKDRRNTLRREKYRTYPEERERVLADNFERRIAKLFGYKPPPDVMEALHLLRRWRVVVYGPQRGWKI